MALSWNDLFLKGSVVDLNTGHWSARLSSKPSDLGLVDSEAVSKALSLGAYRLAPAEAFKSINEVIAKAKRAVEFHSLTFGFIRGARYVPSDNLSKLLDVLRELKVEFDGAVDSFISQYEETKASMMPLIERALQEACKTPEAAANALLRVRTEYPTSDEVRGKFNLTWKVYAIQGAKAQGVTAAMAAEGETVKGVIGEMVSQLRAEVTERLSAVLAVLQRGGTLNVVSIRAAHELLERVELVNVMGDAVLSEQVARMRKALAGVGKGKDVSESTVKGLVDIKRELEESVADAIASAERALTSVGRRKLKAA
jgi:hypothetical protein